MTTVRVFHEVDDVDHWVSSPKREEFFGPLGMTVRTFVDPDKTNRVGLIVTVPDLDTLRTALATPAKSISSLSRKQMFGALSAQRNGAVRAARTAARSRRGRTRRGPGARGV